MNISIFEVTGPVMIGPSSSHTAGAARLARIAGIIAEKPFNRVSFGLHGSFAKTYKGHGTDKALIAGALGFAEDDERMADAFSYAKQQGLQYDFYEIDLDGMHENSVKMTFYFADGGKCDVVGSSIGGAQIIIKKINGFEIEFDAMLPTILISQQDQKGVVSRVTRVLADGGINIGVMKLSRKAKGDMAFCVIETDDHIDKNIVEQIRAVSGVLSVQAVEIQTREG